jgi:hypothetical protein
MDSTGYYSFDQTTLLSSAVHSIRSDEHQAAPNGRTSFDFAAYSDLLTSNYSSYNLNTLGQTAVTNMLGCYYSDDGAESSTANFYFNEPVLGQVGGTATFEQDSCPVYESTVYSYTQNDLSQSAITDLFALPSVANSTEPPVVYSCANQEVFHQTVVDAHTLEWPDHQADTEPASQLSLAPVQYPLDFDAALN